MTDIHCHILFGVDDGSRSIEETLAMAAAAARGGTRAVIATPHCNLPGERPNYPCAELASRLDEARAALDRAGIPLRLYPGAEVFCSAGLPELLARRRLQTLADSRYLLSEFDFGERADEMDRLLRSIERFGYVPVVAHPERYAAVQYEPGLIGEWFSRGYIIQLNKDSVLGNLGRRCRRAALWVLERGLAHAVASDGHGEGRRGASLAAVRDYIENEISIEYARVLFDENPERIINDQPMLEA